MTAPRLVAMLCVLSLSLPVLGHAKSDPCRQFLMRHDDLRQLYARGDGMALRIPPVREPLQDITSARVHDVARRKLQAAGLYDPDAPQWLAISVRLDVVKYSFLMSLRRWADDLGYGLPGESTVWVLGGGERHQGSTGRVLTQVSRRLDEFIASYRRAQEACR